MSDDWSLEQIEEYKKKIYDEAWNAAIEAAVKECNSKSHIMLPLEARLSLLKKK